MSTDDYEGELLATAHDDGTVTIERADPRLKVAAEFLDAIRAGSAPFASIRDDVLKVHATDRTVIYRIGEKVPNRLAYFAEWPD
jgi:hypothetical protein